MVMIVCSWILARPRPLMDHHLDTSPWRGESAGDKGSMARFNEPTKHIPGILLVM